MADFLPGLSQGDNLLPKEGELRYSAAWLEALDADRCLDELLADQAWSSDRIRMFGKTIVTDRKVIWFGDEGLSYTYSGVKKQPLAWNPVVQGLKSLVEQEVGCGFNSCLANLYHHGGEGMGWHSDDEPELGPCPTIAVISLGATRKFKLKHKATGTVVDVMLEHGSLTVMSGQCQECWRHTLAKSARVAEPRISLTFRKILY